MQTIEEYKEYAKQLEGEVKTWHDAYDAAKIELRIARESNRNTSLELKDLIEQYNEEKERIEALEEERRWRKASEELPEKHKWVFVIGNRMMQIAKMVENGWIDDHYNYLNVTHWMPLPKAPKTKDIGKRR